MTCVVIVAVYAYNVHSTKVYYTPSTFALQSFAQQLREMATILDTTS